MFALTEAKLAVLIRPAGYFNVKARRLRSFLRVLVERYDGNLNRLIAGDTALVRGRLLAIHDIGPETADSMLLYAGGHHSFVIDAYTKRVFQRHGWTGANRKSEIRNPKSAKHVRKLKAREARFKVRGSASDGLSYNKLKALCERVLNHKAGKALLGYWQDYHAQLVMVGKHFCRTRNPLCNQCPLRPLLPNCD